MDDLHVNNNGVPALSPTVIAAWDEVKYRAKAKIPADREGANSVGGLVKRLSPIRDDLRAAADLLIRSVPAFCSLGSYSAPFWHRHPNGAYLKDYIWIPFATGRDKTRGRLQIGLSHFDTVYSEYVAYPTVDEERHYHIHWIAERLTVPKFFESFRSGLNDLPSGYALSCQTRGGKTIDDDLTTVSSDDWASLEQDGLATSAYFGVGKHYSRDDLSELSVPELAELLVADLAQLSGIFPLLQGDADLLVQPTRLNVSARVGALRRGTLKGTGILAPSKAFVPGLRYTRRDVQALLGLEPTRGGNWDTGYHKHDDNWYLFPNVGVAGRTGHDYDNAWEQGRLRWYGKPNSRLGQPAISSMLIEGARIHLFTRDDARDPFTYHGLVRPVSITAGTPVTILWEVIPNEHTKLAEFNLPGEVTPEHRFREGMLRVVLVSAHERSPAARQACLRHWGSRCVVCNLDLSERYGPIANGLIHVHHLVPMAEVAEEYEINAVKDLRPVCPNCHAVIHRGKRPLSIEEAQALLRNG